MVSQEVEICLRDSSESISWKFSFFYFSFLFFQDRPSHKTPKPRTSAPKPALLNQGAVKGVYLKGLFAQSRLFYREMNCPVRFYREMDCPVQWSLATPSALESQPIVNHGSVVANPICKCSRHKAGHLQVRVAVGRWSTCVLKEAPLNKGPLGFPH